MSTEFINRITVKKDGVYISSHSSNDTAPFHSWRCKGLSEIYAAEGQKGLDREIVCMLYEYVFFRGTPHPSAPNHRRPSASNSLYTLSRCLQQRPSGGNILIPLGVVISYI